ncbi:23S rRNA (cytidine1920-2'-O)/16S rRNA (cytidine1409-2'-O)-methyltransferase [Evansella caseinilytica]|uniref:23S rRNA (Cytidine1920-2'-O)/16S rRNA (Cytidine1409-2'-O)-methyltransferase n=1 Tax=Evansella caseinilytica TaxID=1503961 RepID=A0A1H3KX86_9BACI|nr:TlyA family RNA methyltransferase [Evansella caseinilytica]SDY56783.1 23S rRNA (cytidine1920-2'-O)/16S rRNA (cytidine1409-2'-O)-methyltransferase [Evansella caseinilytica]
MEKKQRIDVLLVDKGLSETREKAKRSIMAGLVYADGDRVDKPGTKVSTDSHIELKGQAIPYVSRGGLKLKKAIQAFQLTLEDKIVLDIGASTGGFTDCALQEGAKLVYALDVGYNQLAWKLRQDERVIVMERTNFRYVTAKDFQEGAPDFATIDVSFISLKRILPVLKMIIKPGGQVSALVKPQFEAGREEVGKKGIVRDRQVHVKVLQEIIAFAEEVGFEVRGITYSPIRGGEGNIEFLLHLTAAATVTENEDIRDQVETVVNDAHQLKQ